MSKLPPPTDGDKPQGAENEAPEQTPVKKVTAKKMQLIKMEQVQAKPVTFLWSPYVPFGKITILDGEPDKGKSLISLDIVARASVGRPMPPEPQGLAREPIKSLLLCQEDGIEDTVVNRLIAAAADLHKIRVSIDSLSLDTELQRLENTIIEEQFRLLVFDPLFAYLGRVKSHNDQEVRGVLTPLAKMAERLNVAIIAIRHLNKQVGGSAMNRGGGSIAVSAVARGGLILGVDPDDERYRILAPYKHNLTRDGAPSLRYQIIETQDKCPRIEWIGTCDIKADWLVSLPESEESRSAREDAAEFLREFLADGPMPQESIAASAKQQGITLSTLRRAKKAVSVRSVKAQGKDSAWLWSLPQPANQAPPLGHVDHLDHLPNSPVKPEGDGR
jgi:hypothetical protein